ncbi:MAG: GNAT family N-acetyltransferase [Candidatus Dormibacteria bacterium]
MFQTLFRRPLGGSIRLKAEWVSSLSAVKAEEWDRISASAGLYLSRPYLLAVEESESTISRYLLLRDPSGRLVAGLPTYLWDGRPDPGLDHYEPFEAGARWVLRRPGHRERWIPTLIAGSRSGYGTQFAVHHDWAAPDRGAIGRLLWDLGGEADRIGAGSLGVMWLTSAAARPLAQRLTSPELLVLAGPNCSIEVGWASFDGYLAQLSSSRRRSARRELEHFRSSGLRVTRQDLGSCLEQLASLAVGLQRKYGHQHSQEALTGQLQAQARHLNSESRVLLCHRGRRLVAFTLHYRWKGELYGRLAGFDYSATAGSDAYFNLAFYEPLRMALEEGLREFHLGMATWRAKALRGANFDPAWTLVCPPPRVRAAFGRAARADPVDGARWWARQFPAQVDCDGDWRWTRQGLLSRASGADGDFKAGRLP